MPQELRDTRFGELHCDTEVDFAQHEVKTGVARMEEAHHAAM